MRSDLGLLAALVSLSRATTLGNTVECRVVEFTVSAQADNVSFGNDFDPNNATTIDEFVVEALTNGGVATNGTVAVERAFAVSAQYCGSSTPGQQLDSIQILVHGNLCDRSIWDSLGEADLQATGYSYQQHAAARGVATLAVDMIGHGSSAAPDPATVVQMPVEAAILNAIANSLRTRNNPLNQSFEKVVFVGHSFGAVSGVATARLYPTFADVLVLSGWSAFLPLPSPLLLLQMHPASLLDERFDGLPLGYIAASNASGFEDVFFAGDFDSSIPQRAFNLSSVMTVGEGGTIGIGLQPASGYQGMVLVVTGSLDPLFCNQENGTCDEQLAGSTSLLPSATRFDTYVIPQTGHDYMLHYSASETFSVIQDWVQKAL